MRIFTQWLTTAALMFSAHAFAAEPAASQSPSAEDQQPQQHANLEHVVLQTSLGRVVVELYPTRAPVTVENFLQYVDDGFYDGVIFHRVVPNFVVQVGGFDANYQRKATRPSIKNESDNGLLNLRGTLSMARTMDPNSATSQFFISLRDNPHLDGQGGPGYAVFGSVIEGMDVIDKLPELPQGEHSGVFANAPNEPVLIEKAHRLHPTEQTSEDQEQQAPQKKEQKQEQVQQSATPAPAQ